MSTLKVNDIVEATSGGGKINVARAWVRWIQSSSTIRNDFQISSMTDVSTARNDMNYSVTMESAHYGNSAHANQVGEFSTFGMACGNESMTTTSSRWYVRRVTNHDAFDAGVLHILVFGDLA